MPPRYAYWTILVDNQPTAFRAASQEDLMPTFKRLKEKHPSAVMQWFQNGKLWPSRIDAQEHMRFRGERSREVLSERNKSGESKGRGDSRHGGFRARKRFDSNPRTQDSGPKTEKLEWKPKGEFTPAPKRERSERPEWKPKGSFDRDRKPEWKPRGKNVGANFSSPARGRKPAGEKLEWKPRTESGAGDREPVTRAKRVWIPKEEYKKSQGIEAPRDSKWRPGGAHRDPKQKYKDAKKAKWSKFKKTIRTRWETKAKKKS